MSQEPFCKCPNGHTWPVEPETVCPECGEDWRTREWPMGLPGTLVTHVVDEKHVWRWPSVANGEAFRPRYIKRMDNE